MNRHVASARPVASGVLLALLVAGRAAEGADAVDPPCKANDGSAFVRQRQAATLTDETWDRHPAGSVVLRFRVDAASGRPEVLDARSAAQGRHDALDDEALTRAARDALAGYRFCVSPGDARVWRVSMRFVPVLPSGRYVQLLVPGYTRDDLDRHRSGRAVVRTDFDGPGRPSRVAIEKASGDAAIDAKALSAMAESLLIVRDPTTPTPHLRLDLPFQFDLH